MSDTLSVSDAMQRRQSTRAFIDRPVGDALLKEILTLAGRAPSNSNLQPWRVSVLNGDAMTQFVARFNDGLYRDGQLEEPQYPIYPDPLIEPYYSRRKACGELLYQSLDISREDKRGRLAQVMRNFRFFDAPAGLILSTHESMGTGQAIDVGIFSQSVMLLAAERGLASCPQASWAQWPQRIKQLLDLPDDQQILLGIAIGYADKEHAANRLQQPRLSVEDFVDFVSVREEPV